MLCFVVVMQSFILNSHEIFIHIHQGCFAGTGAIVRLPQCQWSKPVYGKISQCITTTKHSKAKTVFIFLGIYCTMRPRQNGHYFAYIFLTCILSKEKTIIWLQFGCICPLESNNNLSALFRIMVVLIRWQTIIWANVGLVFDACTRL